ncbi:tetratricopeptide repeat-containing sensor histidine kinase [Dyadobacter chenhuakuii]|uniref:Tetratricopeptide repeat protein n=1 Tax=Dyadobacter chenhuakuii TaxID=2909339 RepID=A0ABY4XNU9_9BACT|nr:tetratricopeptide repeat-containing sensor histidine kinase [Dyadobacter chenhuakuii]MCF2494548.1 tetratricopeptide repeat protein [Dyadobacter chenhuakuii]USJ32129.1 tetratricopeptide repeat protein [Dyadobacter chenhuakuii]
MGNLYRLLTILSLATLVSGSRCTSVSDHNDSVGAKKEVVEAVPVEGFAEDTVLILKYHQFAKEYLFQDAEKAMFYSKHVLRLSQKHRWSKGKILAYNLLSTYYLMDGSYDVLRELSNETMSLSKDLPFYTAYSKYFLAESYSEYRQWDSAQINYRQAIAIFEELGEDSSAATCINALGNSYREKSLFAEAIPYYEQAYARFDKMNSDWGRATVLQNRGYLHVIRKEREQAEDLLKRSLVLFQKINNRYGELNVLNDLANIYCLSNQNELAITTAARALDYSTIFHSSQQTNWALLSLARAYKNKKMFREALDYMEKVIFNRRMLHTEYVQRQYTMFQLSYDNQIMDSQIQNKIIAEQRTVQRFLIGFSCLIIAFAAFLWFNNKKLRRKNAEISEAMARGQAIERKRVAAELHDNLGGTLASLNWYLFGIDKKVLSPEEQKIYESVHQMVGAAYREVRSLSHNLMPPELEEHGLVMAMHRLIDKMNENKNIEFSFNVSGMSHRLNNKTEFELYSIVLELTNNIIKHSGANKASINLTENKNIHLTIIDNGNGMVEPSRQGVGLKNVKNRVESLRGKVQIISQQPKGLKVDIEIPKTLI